MNSKSRTLYGIIKTVGLFSFIFISSIYLSSCGDKCKDVLCENGYCIKGDCFCDNGYSGDQCEIKESDKYAGKYVGKLKFADIPTSQNVDVNIKNFDFNPFDIQIKINSHNGVEFFYLNAHVDKDSIFVEKSFNEHTTQYDTIINLIYPSKGKLVNDSTIEIPIIYKNIDYPQVYSVNLSAVKQK